MSVMQLPNGKWRAQVRRKDCPKLDKVFETEAEAKAAEQAALGVREKPQEGAFLLRAVWERYQGSRDYEEKAQSTQKTELVRIKPVLAELGHIDIRELGKALLKDYIDKRSRYVSPRTQKKLSGTSIRLELAMLATLCNFATDRCLIESNPVLGVKRPQSKKRRRRVSGEEVNNLRMWCEEPRASKQVKEDCRFLLCLYLIGCRPGELAAAKIEHVDILDRSISFLDTKNGEDRRAHLVEEAVILLKEQMVLNQAKTTESSPFIFSSMNRKKEWLPFLYENSVKRLKRLGVIEEDFHAHAMRREFVSKLIESETPLFSIKKQTGHKSIQAVEIYDEGLATSSALRANLDKQAEQSLLAERIRWLKEELGLNRDQIEKYLKKEGLI